jgi:predicted dehydrogenase
MVETHFRTQAYYDSATWRATWKGEGGGVLLNQAPHGIDIFMMLMGLPKSLKAVTRTHGHHIEVEDEASAMIEWEGGANGYYHTSTVEQPGANLMEICGEEGKLVYSGGVPKFYSLAKPISEFNADSTNMWGGPDVTEEPVEVIGEGGSHEAVISNWARAILTGEERLSPGEEGLNSLEFINAVILSGATGNEVSFPVPRKEYDDFIQDKIKNSTFKKIVRKQQVTDPNLR